MRRALLLALMLTAVPLAARAAPIDVNSRAPEKVAVTIYRDGDIDTRNLMKGYGPDGLVLVRETRTIDLPAGLSRVRFSNVADRIMPQSAAIEGLPVGARERNFDYDLMSPGSLLEKSVGAPVHLIRTNPRTGEEREIAATIRAAPEGVVLEIDGEIEALHCAGLPERLVFDKIPESLMATPTLSALIETPKAGRYQIRLSYLAQGLLWSADYIARIAPGGKTLDLTAWVTLANRSDTTFANAPTEVVAGALSRVDADMPEPAMVQRPARCWPINSGRMQRPVPPPPPPVSAPPIMLAAPMMQRGEDKKDADIIVTGHFIRSRDLGDYKLYELPEPTRIAARQIKQVQFIDNAAVPFQRLYRYQIDPIEMVNDHEGSGKRLTATSVLRMKNDEAHRLGLPLPAGHAAIYEQSAAGEATFAGADRVRDIPIGLPWDIEVAQANDVSVRNRIIREERLKKTTRRVTIEVEIANDKPVAADIELTYLPRSYVRLVSESKGHVLREGLFVWPFKLKAGAHAIFRYAVTFSD